MCRKDGERVAESLKMTFWMTYNFRTRPRITMKVSDKVGKRTRSFKIIKAIRPGNWKDY